MNLVEAAVANVGKHRHSGKFEFESGGLEWLTVERDQLTFEGDVDRRR